MSDQAVQPEGPRRGLGFVDLLSIMVVLALIGVTVIAWFNLPEGRYPQHIGLSGRIDRWSDKAGFVSALGLMTGVTTVIALVLGLCARSRTLAPQIERAGPVFAVGRVLAVFGPAFGAAMIAGVGLGFVPADGDPTILLRMVMGFISLSILAVGEPLGKTKPNAFAGVRSYFTLTSRQAWDKSNRLAGRLFFWIGLTGLIASPFAPQPLGVAVLVGAVILSIVLTVIESWRVWRSDPERREAI